MLGVADNRHASTILANHICFGNVLGGVIGALGLDVGMNFADDGADVKLGEDDDSVDIGKGGENLRAFFRGHQWTALSFQRTYGFIRIDGNDEAAAEFLGGVKIAHVADVQQIEASIGQRNALTGRAPGFYLAAQLVATKYL